MEVSVLEGVKHSEGKGVGKHTFNGARNRTFNSWLQSSAPGAKHKNRICLFS